MILLMMIFLSRKKYDLKQTKQQIKVFVPTELKITVFISFDIFGSR